MNRGREYLAFLNALSFRLEAGERAYGERSFSRDPLALAREVQEELLDVAGWGFILWTRLEQICKALEVVDEGTG